MVAEWDDSSWPHAHAHFTPASPAQLTTTGHHPRLTHHWWYTANTTLPFLQCCLIMGGVPQHKSPKPIPPHRTINYASAVSGFWHTSGMPAISSSGIGKWQWYKGHWGRSGREWLKSTILINWICNLPFQWDTSSMANHKIHPSQANELKYD